MRQGPVGSRFEKKKIIRKIFISTFVLLFFLIPYYGWSSGYIAKSLERLNLLGHTLLSQGGLRVEDVVVEGRVLTSQKEILEILGVKYGDSIFCCSLVDTKKALAALPWVRSVAIQRRLPNTLYIRLSEHHPIALWQNKRELYLIDSQGKVLENVFSHPQAGLLVLTGEGAPERAATLLETLSEFPSINKQVTGATFVGKRRWDIFINHKLRLKLSEKEMKRSLESFENLAQKHKLEDKEIMSVDLRFKDRIYFELSPQALERKKNIGGKST
jgi:cell division protein FtsQ